MGSYYNFIMEKKVPQNRDYSYLIEMHHRPMTTYRKDGDLLYSLEHLKQEFPEYGTTDFRHPAISIKQANGSNLTNFTYKSHQIITGKKTLEGMPATYVENEQEAKTLLLTLEDQLLGVEIELSYTLFDKFPVLTRNAKVVNNGVNVQSIEQVASLSVDLPDRDYDWMQLSGAWGRERYVKERKLQQGIQSIESTRGISSHQHNPFVALKRENTDEFQGEVIGATLVYSGNFF